jgi:hypothetical protein
MPIPLLAAFPRFRTAAVSWPVFPPEKRAEYPELAQDFAIIDEVVTASFTELDEAAMRNQNRYRRQQVLVLVGSALVTGLGGLQAALSEQRWPGLLLALLAAGLATSSRWAREDASLTRYLDARAKAERLRALQFEFLSATGR